MECSIFLDYQELWIPEDRYALTRVVVDYFSGCTNPPGLRREDLYDDDVLDVQEAVRRLPETEMNLRNYRLKRAFDLTMKHSILPRDQWTKPEEVGHI